MVCEQRNDSTREINQKKLFGSARRRISKRNTSIAVHLNIKPSSFLQAFWYRQSEARRDSHRLCQAGAYS